MKALIRNIFFLIACMVAAVSCIEDSVATSPSVQPEFSTDTLHMGTVFTQQGTPTFRFVVYNRHDKILNIDDIRIRSGERTFRINVDGFSGTVFNNVEIRPNDSIYVFVEATPPASGSPVVADVEDIVDFTTRGVTRSVVLNAQGQDVTRHRALTITRDTTWTPDYPHQIFDSLVVAPGATLTIAPGTALHFHDGALMRVYGSLRSLGTAEKPVQMAGDRTDNVVGDISFDLMASQWRGLHFAPESKGNLMTSTVVRNTVGGVLADSLSQVEFINCRLRNSAGFALMTWHADVAATGCEIADASQGVAYFHGGRVSLDYCTVANYYLFTALGGPALTFSHVDDDTDDLSGLPRLHARINNSIIYGNGSDLSHGDLTGTDVVISRTLLKSAGSDDDNFISCIWDADPLYYTVREDYIFDYRLRPDSPAIGVADGALSPLRPETSADFYGVARAGAIGAYEYTEPEEEP